MAYIAGTYDAWQTTFLLSFLSDTNSQTVVTETLSSSQSLTQATAAAQATLTANLGSAVAAAFANPATQALIGNDWQVVWGPEVYVEGAMSTTETSAKFTTSNAMFVAYSPNSKVGSGTGRYVVAIAGTNPESVYDWIAEDIVLAPGQAWQQALQTWGKNDKASNSASSITYGTFLGVSNLLGMTSAGKSLVEYLNTLTPGTATLTVTGHSLGGALSPTLALALVDPNNPLLPNWSKSQVNAYPTAGATPGNEAFASYYLDTLPPSVSSSPWQVWNAVVWNRFDVVPNAWIVDLLGVEAATPNLAKIPFFYKESGEYGWVQFAEISATATAADAASKCFTAQCGALGHLNTPAVNGMLNENVSAADAFAWASAGAAKGTDDIPAMTVPQQKAAGYQASQFVPMSIENQVIYQHIAAYLEMILQLSPAVAGKGIF